MLKKISKIVTNLIFAGLIILAIGVLFSFLPIKGNYKMFVVESGSMEPSIHTGSLVIVKPVGEYQIGDVITRSSALDAGTTTHRIFSLQEKDGETIYDTKGDANNTQDGAEIHRADIIGKVYVVIPWVGYAVNFFKTPIGFTIIILIPTLIIVYEEIVKIKKEVVRIKKEKVEKKNQKEMSN